MNIQTDLGPVRQTYKGLWDSAYEYELLNTVRYNGSLYICRSIKSIGDIPSEGSAIWSLVSKDGVLFVSITAAPADNKLVLQGTPLYVKLLDNNTVYTITSDDCYVNHHGNYVFDIRGVLAVNNMDKFEGPWEVYFTNTAVYDEPLINDMLDDLNGESVGVEPETKILAAADSKNAIAMFLDSKGVSTAGVPFSDYVEKIDEAFETSGGAVVMEAIDRLNGEPTSDNTLEAIEAAITSKEAIAEAVSTKGGSITEETPFSEYAECIAHIPGAVVGSPSDGPRVRFFDYDGTLLKTEYVPVGSAATPPELPQHERLVFQEWNNDFTNITRDKDTGAIYTTRSGATEIDIILGPSSGVTLTLSISISAGEVTIDWGDGTTDVTTATNPSHTYAAYGEYTLSISGNWYPAAYKFGSFMSPRVHRRMFIADGVPTIKCADLPNGIEVITVPASCRSLDISALPTWSAVSAVITPKHVASLASIAAVGVYTIIPTDNAMTSFAGLRGFSGSSIYIPDGVIAISNGALRESGVRSVYIPPSVTTVGDKALMYCYKLISVFFDCPNLASIGTDCFLQDANLRLVRLSATTPPAITTTTFSATTLCSILVPKGCAEAYKTATNWSAYADVIEEMEE